MRGRLLGPVAILLTATLAACTATPEPTATPAPSATVTATVTVTPSPSGAATAAPEPTGEACAPFGTDAASASSPDWYADLRAELWGVTMRVGTHDCYDRWVFEFAGEGAMPGWSVTPHDASTFAADPVDEPFAPPLAGAASLDVAFAAWYDGTPLGEAPYAGDRVIVTDGFPAIAEARILTGFEGISHVGIGLDEPRPYRVTWLDDPGRLVVDVYTG